jgi:hypothetical protein
MEDFLPDARVSDYSEFLPLFPRVYPKDKHVAAAAKRVQQLYADEDEAVPVWLVTWNLQDFQDEALAAHGIRLCTPDEALADLLGQAPNEMCNAFREHMTRMSVSKPTFSAYCDSLASKNRLQNFSLGLKKYSSRFGTGWPP